MRIGIYGPSGTGKSTLAKYIAETYDIPFITTSTKPLWEKLGVESHADLIHKTNMKPGFGMKFQWDVLGYRIDALDGKASFVTDRTPIDNAVYTLLQCADKAPFNEIDNYIKMCIKYLDMFDEVIYLPFNNEIPLEDDGMRIINPYYQRLVGNTFDMVEKMMNVPNQKRLKLDYWNWNLRCVAVNRSLLNLLKLKADGKR